MERVCAAFTRSPRKSTRCSSCELGIPQTTVWRVLKKRLQLKPYRLQLVQALKNNDYLRRMEFCNQMLQMEDDENFCSLLIFSDEATFHLNGKVNRHNVRIWGTENPHEIIQYERDSPKVNVFCAVSCNKVYGPFFFEGNSVIGQGYKDMLRHWLFPLMEADSNE